MHLALLLVAALAVVSGCSKKDGGGGGGTCTPLVVTVDGTALPAMPHGLARTNNMNGDITVEVQMFNHDKVACEAMVSKAGRQIADGEQSVRAFAGGTGMMAKGVGIESHTQAGGEVRMIGDKPKAVGDVVKICVDNVSFKPRVGELKDKQVTVTGLFEGKHCGELTY